LSEKLKSISSRNENFGNLKNTYCKEGNNEMKKNAKSCAIDFKIVNFNGKNALQMQCGEFCKECPR